MSAESPILAALSNRAGAEVLLLEGERETTVADAVRFVESLRTCVLRLGLDESARLCVVMPNGRLLAVTALAAMSVGSFAPLNPRLTEEEFVSVFSDLEADALVSISGFAQTARHAARHRGMFVIEVAEPALFSVVVPATRR